MSASRPRRCRSLGFEQLSQLNPRLNKWIRIAFRLRRTDLVAVSVFATREISAAEAAYLEQVRESLRSSSQTTRDHAAYYATTLMERGLPVLFDLRHLAIVTGLEPSVVASMAAYPLPHYTTFRIAKRSGGSREISAPRPALKHVQLWINREILNAMRPHESCHGFTTGRSIVTNAAPHVQARLILKLDLRDFFPSVDRRAVFRVFRRVGYTRSISRLLAGLTTLRNSLPQGAPSSPQLANYAAYDMDTRLARLAEKHGIQYTRYADDLTFSGEAVERSAVKRTIERVVRDAGFRPNERKARYLHPHQRQEVTGIVVNSKLSWPRAERRRLRQEVYYVNRFGVESHLSRREGSRSRYKEHLFGRIYALNSARSDDAVVLLEQLHGVEWPY